MATSGRGTGIVGYNVQTAVDTKHHLIVAHEVTNVGHDRTQLRRWRSRRSRPSARPITALADRGYFNGDEILSCEQAGVAPIVPKPLTSNNKARPLRQEDFVYDADDDTTPARRANAPSIADGGRERQTCTGTGLRPVRLSAQAAMHDRQDGGSRAGSMRPCSNGCRTASNSCPRQRVRRQTVEHPFGTLKAWMGATHFLTRTLRRSEPR